MSQQVTVTQGRYGDLVVHKAGCAHLRRLPRTDYTETFTASSMVAVAERVYADQIAESEDWGPQEYAQSFEVAPCVTISFTEPDATPAGVQTCASCGATEPTTDSPDQRWLCESCL